MNKEQLEIKIEEQNLVIQELNSVTETLEVQRENSYSNEVREVLGLSIKEIAKNIDIEEFILDELNTDLERLN